VNTQSDTYQQEPEMQPPNPTTRLPAIYAIDEKLDTGVIQQLIFPARTVEVTEERYEAGGLRGRIITPFNEENERILIIASKAAAPDDFNLVLGARRVGRSEPPTFVSHWMKHPALAQKPQLPIDYSSHNQEVVESWRNAFSYKEEDLERHVQGLRSPQAGAIHAAHAHWVTTDKVATIVMPTGIGKTETMLSLLISKQCGKLLVVVPSDALRTQLADKFLTLGVLKGFEVISQDARYPVVGILKHKPRNVEGVDTFFQRCNVIVTTAHIAGQCSDEVQARMAELCPYLFIDEAHHIGATTWLSFKQKFESRKILQFTATPFRNDGKLVGGKIIFNYPLRKALEEEYFKTINFKPVIAYDRREADEAIAEKAVEQLREDCQQYDHILMARVESIERAREVYAIYQRYLEFNPVQIHTGITSKKERDRIRQMIIAKEARIVVCVDMLGEGFDLPELKIAAFHDIKKSLAITLQLAGRFTRARRDLGDPTFIANIGDVEVRDELRKLYIQDADWNALLTRSSEEVIQEQVDLWEFLEGFHNFPDEIPLQTMKPALSTVIYKTRCEDWTPENFKEGIPGHENLERIHYDINHQQSTMVIVTARKVPIDWAHVQDIFNWDWELFILHWDREQNLLFINSSSNSGYYKELAQAVAGEIELIHGAPVFRCFAGVNRLKLQNVGLAEQLGRLIRYTMRAGSDVETGLTEAQKRNARKSNIFGNGYEGGGKASVGCSYKGRIWSQRTGNIESLTKWCRSTGRKVLDENINPDEILRGTLTTVQISERPRKMPISIEWPEEMYKESETAYEFVFDGETTLPLYATELVLVDPSEEEDIRFELASDKLSAAFTLNVCERDEVKDYSYSIAPNRSVMIKRGVRQVALERFFQDYPPVIWFADGASLSGNSLTELKKKYPPYPADRIRTWDWAGTVITKESQKAEKRPDSVQFRVIRELMNGDYDIIFDDDDKGEAADVVAIRIEDHAIHVELYHCKFSGEERPGARLDDLYVVCGQAQKCVHLMDDPTKLFRHLLRRDAKSKGGREGRFERGDQATLLKITEMSRALPTYLTVYIVQPGLSKGNVTVDLLELLSVTENYLMETYKIPFCVIASP
jgi:superfamily II DNA or RNA helicase